MPPNALLALKLDTLVAEATALLLRRRGTLGDADVPLKLHSLSSLANKPRGSEGIGGAALDVDAEAALPMCVLELALRNIKKHGKK